MEQKTDSLEFLIDAKAALESLNDQKKKRAELAVEEKRQERLLEGEKKAVEDEIYRTVRERKAAVETSYDRELAQDREKLRKLKSKKERAKSAGRQERIREETGELIARNRSLETKIATAFRKNAIPSACNSWVFYALFLPRTVPEGLFDVLAFLLVFEVLPCGIFLLIPDAQAWMLAALYSAVILVFGCGYVGVMNRLKVRKLAQLRHGRAIRDEISSNKKKIRVITRAIHRDASEDPYHLDSYNYEIARLEAELEEVASRKQENLNTFEAVTKKVIADEIMENNKERILKIQEEYRSLHQKLLAADKALREATMQVTGTYESYLGKEFLDVNRVESLIQIVESGQASNVTEAIAVYKDSKI